MTILEAAGLTRDEADEFVFAFNGPSTSDGMTIIDARRKIAAALAAELEALRPIQAGDVVTIPLTRDEFRVEAVAGDDVWVYDLIAGGRLTVKLDCIERVTLRADCIDRVTP